MGQGVGMDQEPPKGDARYRVHESVKCYVAELLLGTAGATWYFDQSAERVLHVLNGKYHVQYQNCFYPLQPSERMVALAKEQLARDGTISVGGKRIASDENDQSFEPHPFIDVTPPDDHLKAEAIFAAR